MLFQWNARTRALARVRCKGVLHSLNRQAKTNLKSAHLTSHVKESFVLQDSVKIVMDVSRAYASLTLRNSDALQVQMSATTSLRQSKHSNHASASIVFKQLTYNM